jgi:Ca2+/H+ antiporter, TMEM165/GDT1 family
MLSASELGVLVASFLAAGVEFVEALTIVLAMGVARSWRAALWGTATAVVALTAVTAALGAALGTYVSRPLLQLVVGALLLIFGLQWLRKAILRASGLKAVHDEDAVFDEEQAAARAASADQRFGLDWYAFVISFKGVFLEGLEVVFIVITFGANARSVPLAASGAAAAGLLVLALGIAVHRPLAAVPENTLKYAVGLMLSTFGVFWTVEGLGVFAPHRTSLSVPGGDAALLVLLAAWLVVSQVLIRALRAGRVSARAVTA